MISIEILDTPAQHVACVAHARFFVIELSAMNQVRAGITSDDGAYH
ncbi:hypothetical protein M2401_002409 [Pseudomonas sp. JUb42]|jgi:hypothetical protein|nr:hypothetical protein [Pseudomonas sp. JUb42]MCS3468674.1 hypothetical protein [Pseudomonas sp. JUb42]